MANWKTVGSLIPQIERLMESLPETVPESEAKECERRKTLKR